MDTIGGCIVCLVFSTSNDTPYWIWLLLLVSSFVDQQEQGSTQQARQLQQATTTKIYDSIEQSVHDSFNDNAI
jgi:hypothetical protein